MFWITGDVQALIGFKQLGVSVESADVSAVSLPKFQDAMKAAMLATGEAVAKGATTVVVDTVSAIDVKITADHISRGAERFDLYRAVLHAHTKFELFLNTLEANIIYLCHSKAVLDQPGTSDAAKAASEAKALKEIAAGTSDVIPAITGAALNLYRGDVSLEFAVTREKRGAPPVDGFWFHSAHAEMDTKARFILPRVMPADWRVVRQLCGLEAA